MKKLLQSLFILCLIASSAIAQDRTITGTVTGKDDGLPIPGVSVKIAGTSQGTSTGTNGNYSIKVSSESASLEFSSIGYVTQVKTIGSSNVVDVALGIDAKQLGEVVVTAMGVSRSKRDLGYTTQTIKQEQLLDKGDGNILNALQGKVAGADITGASGSAGSSTNIILRGPTSFTGDNSPLFVVDGIPISNNLDQSTTTLYGNQPANRALDLNPNNIESVNVLVGPAAAALYGSRASNGAIVITTKKGSGAANKTVVTLNSAYNIQNVSGLPELQNEYGQGANGIFGSTQTFSWGPKFGSTPTLANGLIVAPGTAPNVNGVIYSPGQTIDYRPFEDNFKSYFQQGHTFENNLSIGYGDAKDNYNLSIGNIDQKGILPTSKFGRTTLAFSATKELNKKLSVGGSINYFNTLQSGASTQGNGANSSMFRLFSITRSTDLAYYKEHYKNEDGTNNWWGTGDNPYFAAYENGLKSNLSRFLGNVNVSYNVLDWLNVGYRLGLDTYTDRRKRSISPFSTQAVGGRVLEDQFFRSELNGDLLITAKKDNILTEGLNASLLLGQNINQRVFQNVSVDGIGLAVDGFYNVGTATDFNASAETSNKRRLLGYYGQLSLAYNNYLFLEVTGRADQSSTLPIQYNTYFYPAVSSSFVFTEAFKLQSDILSFGKVRASFARVGKDAPVYSLENTFTKGGFGNNTASITFPFDGSAGFGASSEIPNPLLKPEFTTAYEFGTNLGFFKNRINLDATYYTGSSKDQIVSVAMPTSTGYNSRVLNIGKMTNKGVEVVLNATIVKSSDVTWDMSANFSKNVNKVVSIAPGVESFQVPGSVFGGVIPSIVVGQPYGVIVGSKYQRNENGDLLVDKTTGLYYSSLITNQVVANPNRDWQAGLSTSVRYKNFTFGGLVDYKKGGDLISWTVATLRGNGSLKETAVDRDLPHVLPGVIDMGNGVYAPNNIQIPTQTYWNSGFGGIGGGEFASFDATTFRLRELSLSYDLTSVILKSKAINNIRLTVYGRNLYYYAPNSPIDPEINTQGAGSIRGLELQSAPNTRNFGASLRVTF